MLRPLEAAPVRPPLRTRLLLALLGACVLLFTLTAAVPDAGAAPKSLKTRTKVVPKAGAVVRGTLSANRCQTRFPGRASKLKVTVTGPLATGKGAAKKNRKLKARKLQVRKKGARTARCTWRTKNFRDGRYRLTVRSNVRYRGRSWRLTANRIVTVANAPVSTAATGSGPRLGVGNTRFVGRLESQWDPWIGSADAARRTLLRQRMWGVVGYPGFFDAHTAWAPQPIAYKDLYAIYRDDSRKLAAHPDWVLKDRSGGRMAIPWGCDPGPCPQYAGDIGNPAFRAAWIAEARDLLRRGYTGLWIDDANMEMRVSDERGVERAPIDPRTGREMTYEDWRRYLAEFLEEIRRQLPGAQIVANVLWFGGTSVGRDRDPYVLRAYGAVDRLNLERGFNDSGLTNGSEPKDIWSVDAFMAFIDRMHDRGIPVTLDSAGFGEAAWEYNLAGYFLVDRGADALGELRLQPGDWWAGWDVKLGRPLGERSRGSDGVYRREFAGGLAVLNPPRGAARTHRLSEPMRRIDGSVVTSVTLPPGSGAVLLRN